MSIIVRCQKNHSWLIHRDQLDLPAVIPSWEIELLANGYTHDGLDIPVQIDIVALSDTEAGYLVKSNPLAGIQINRAGTF